MAVIWWNTAGALAALLANVYAAIRGDSRLRPIRTAVAALAAFYLLGYTLLLAELWDLAEWGTFYRKASIVVWAVVWVAPAVLGARTNQRTTRALQEWTRGDGS